jgi:hypothetical protein
VFNHGFCRFGGFGGLFIQFGLPNDRYVISNFMAQIFFSLLIDFIRTNEADLFVLFVPCFVMKMNIFISLKIGYTLTRCFLLDNYFFYLFD